MRWKLNICPSPQDACVLVGGPEEGGTGDFWDATFWTKIERKCSAHAVHSDIPSLIAAVQKENQSMSFTRQKLAEFLQVEPAEIPFEFDASRNCALVVPAAVRQRYQSQRQSIDSEVAKIDPTVKIRNA